LDQTVAVSRGLPGGSARHLTPYHRSDSVLHRSDVDQLRPFSLQYLKKLLVADELTLEAQTLSGRLRSSRGHRLEGLTLVNIASGDRQRLAIGPTDLQNGRFSALLPPSVTNPSPAAPHGVETWSLRANTPSKESVLVTVEAGVARDLATRTGHGTTISVQQSHRGALVLHVATSIVEVDDARMRDEFLELSGRLLGMSDGRLTLRLSGSRATSMSVTGDVQDGSFSLSMPLRHQAWRFGELPLPAADYTLTYSLELLDGHRSAGSANVAGELSERLPLSYDGDIIAMTLSREMTQALHAGLVAPVGQADRGWFARNQAELSHLAYTGAPTLDGLLIESNFGEIADGNAVAIQMELQRRGADLPVYWTVKDYSVPVPEGGIPVVRSSSEWFERLRTAKYLLENMYQPSFHRRTQDQVIIQTFHGYPFKVMGHPHWKNLQLSQQMIESYDARASEWNYLVSPARYATPYLRRDFAYEGEVLEIGYPRNDILRSADAPTIRAETRRALGIDAAATVALYAPTFRDYLSEDDHRAFIGDFLDAERLAGFLGDDYVLLVRGHAFHARNAERQVTSDNVIEVTDYPDPTDLYLASDLAILDYSSLRFDYAITGKPMLFLVPDLDRYRDTRGWLLDYHATAPGPLLSTTEEVASAIQELDSVVETHHEAYALFQKTYLDLEDGHASERFVDAVFVPRGDAPA
ncbi:MAG: CDP-glycerol glycerophosphotransferase family protein, partial [Nocardioidaceae bacterium]